MVLLIAALISFILANSSWAEAYNNFINTPVQFMVGDIGFDKTLLLLVNDGLMAIFFFLIGLEIKKEIMNGELSSPSKASFSIFGALGGMLVPAAMYLWMTHGTPYSGGWGIPMATDIAFALGAIALLGKRVPTALKVFLLALAIVDDLGAILVIAFFYTNEVATSYLGLSAAMLAMLYLFNKAGLRHIVVGLTLGVLTWFFFLKSGVHATLAGVLLAMVTPTARPGNSGTELLEHYIHELHPWSAYFIMPVFALFNAGVTLGDTNLASVAAHPLSLGIVLGLVVGKPVGILATSFIATKLKIATKPEEISWMQVLFVGSLAGIGFTMSLFISGLAFGGADFEAYSKLGIIIASVISAVVGLAGLRLCR